MPNLQILQVVLFTIPVLTFLMLGGLILLKPVAVISRRWMPLALIPLLLDNLLAILRNETLTLTEIFQDGYFWLILGADLALGIGVVLFSRDVAVYGLTLAQVRETLVRAMQAEGFSVEAGPGEWKSFLGQTSEAVVIRWEKNEEQQSCAITSRSGEVMIRAKSRNDLKQLRAFINAIRRMESPYVFSQHAVGVLYLVVAVVLAVLGWIYFFEPRLILIE